MPDDGRSIGLPRDQISRPGTSIEGGLPVGRPALADRGGSGRGVLTVAQSASMPGPMTDAERAAISARIAQTAGANLGCNVPWSPYCRSNTATQTTPTAPAVLTGPSDPLDTLSDVFRQLFGNEGATSPMPGQQALTPVTTGGGGSSLIWILLLGGIGVAVYLYYRRRSAT